MIKDMSKKGKLMIAIIAYGFAYEMLDNKYEFSKNKISKSDFIDEMIKREIMVKKK